MRRLLDNYKDGKLLVDISAAEVKAPPTPASSPQTPRGRTESPGRARSRSQKPGRLDAADDDALQRDLEDVMSDLDRSKLPEPIRDSDQDRFAVQLVQMKRNLNTVAEASDAGRTRTMLDAQIPMVEEMKVRARRIVDGAPAEQRENAERAYYWFADLADKYLKDLRKRVKGEPAPIKMRKGELSVARAIKDKSSSPQRAASRRSPTPKAIMDKSDK
jgi:hypothetical protein